MLRILILGLTIVMSLPVVAQDTGKRLFDNSKLHRIDLEAPQLEALLLWPAFDHPGPVKLKFDGIVVDSVYIRRKGYTSNEFNNTNPPFKIDLNHFVPNQEFDGLDIFNLHNHLADDTYLRNALSYALYRRAGVPAPRTAFAEVFINGQFIDIYTITEDIDKDFLKQNFASDNGSLYKGVEFPPDGVRVNKGTMDAYNHYVQSITAANWGNFADFHNFFRVIMIDQLINDDPGGQNDYQYYEPLSQKMYLVTWDHNFSYNGDPAALDTAYLLNPKVPFFDQVKAKLYINAPGTRELYLETLCTQISYLLDDDFVVNTTSQFYQQLTSGNQQVTIEKPDAIVEYLKIRKTAYQNTLQQLGYTNCQNLNPSGELSDLVINEFVAKSDKNGILNPNGENADWIELYNLSDKSIMLNDRVYLSDDPGFLKKWHFTGTTVLPAKSYTILWADKNVHQQGIHTNFKLNADAGQILLSFEDQSVLQSIRYQKQSNNLASARIPNGTGSFVIQKPTLAQNNENATSTEGFPFISKSLVLAPNPSTGWIRLNPPNDLDSAALITVLNAQGMVVHTQLATQLWLNLSALPEGPYWIQLTNGKELYTGQVLLKHQ